jgi:phage terminase large subunit-like protein
MIAPTASKVSYKRFFKGGDGKCTQEVPVPIRNADVLVGYEYKQFNIPQLLKSIPYYDCFQDAEEYYFDLDEMHKFIQFVINEVVFPEGENTGLPFIPEPWQWAVYFNIFCWKSKKTNFRRYSEVFIYVPRKNGKTTAFGSVPTLYMFYVDKEQRSQNFCCAADLEQASVNFRHTSYIIENNPNLLNRLRQNKVNRSTKSFEYAKDGSMFKVLSAIAETKHGLSPNYVYIDEVHAHKSSELIDVMITGTAARRQSLTIYTTTADYDRPSTCNQLYDRAISVAKGQTSEPYFLPVIYEAQVDDDFRKESVWKKANPNYGVSIYADYFEKQIRICENNPVLLNRFLRLHLNVRTKTETVWIPSWVWANGNNTETELLPIDEIKNRLYNHRKWHNFAASPEWFSTPQVDIYLSEYQAYYTWYFKKLEELVEAECYGGYDNTSVKDIASFVLYFPTQGIVLPWFWVPAESIYRRSVEERLPYDRWFKSGLINNTPLASISERDIAKALVGDGSHTGICNYFKGLHLVTFDAWGSNFIYETLYNAGLNSKKYPQSYVGMNGPCRRLEAAAENKELFHGTNPVLRWMIGNVSITTNNNDQMRPAKDKSTDKIDGIVALLMAIGGSMYHGQQLITDIPGLKDV